MTSGFYHDLAERLADLEAELNRLDAATGDGDHGTTMLRGLNAARQAPAGEETKAFRRASGGASGSLFGAVLGELAKYLAGTSDLATALNEAVRKVKMLGQAETGDKTMLDALIPAAEAAGAGRPPKEVARASAEGAASTTAMQAKRGRARYVEAGGKGHPDAGARSVAEILAVLAARAEEKA